MKCEMNQDAVAREALPRTRADVIHKLGYDRLRLPNSLASSPIHPKFLPACLPKLDSFQRYCFTLSHDT